MGMASHWQAQRGRWAPDNAYDDPVDLGVFGIERAARPAHHVLVSFVVRIGESFEELLIAPGAADVLGWAGASRLQEPRVDHVGGGIVDPLDADAVIPVIAEVVGILDRPCAGFPEQLLQGHRLRGHGTLVEPVRIGHAPTDISGAELVEMGVGPAHGRLHDLMQPVEPDLQRDLDMAHRLRIDVVQDDPEAGDQAHAAILCRVVDQFWPAP